MSNNQHGLLSHPISINYNIQIPQEEYIAITKKELQTANTSIKSIDNSIEFLKMIGSIILGYSLPFILKQDSNNIQANDMLLFLMSITFIGIGFYLNNRKKSLIDDILERYKTSNPIKNGNSQEIYKNFTTFLNQYNKERQKYKIFLE